MPIKEIPNDEHRNSSSNTSSPQSSINGESIGNNAIGEESVASNSSLSLESVSNFGNGFDNHNDSDTLNNIFINHPVYSYRPINLPKEPSLDQLLREVSGTQNLINLTNVTLKVSSTMVGLQRLNDFMPNLKALNLDGSTLYSLRDLGCNLEVIYLNVSRCSLTSFDGTNGLTTVQHLIADYNHISDVGSLCNLSQLHKLSIRGNKIKDFGTISFLVLCTELKEVDIENNPISLLSNFRYTIKRLIPNILILDGKILYDNCDENNLCNSNDISSSEYSSSLTSSEYLQIERNSSDESSLGEHIVKLTNNIHVPPPPQQQHRSSSSADIMPMKKKKQFSDQQYNRPSTADNYQKLPISLSSLSNGEPIYGNVIIKARKRKVKKHSLLAWDKSKSLSSSSISSLLSISSLSSSSSSSSSSSTTSTTSKITNINNYNEKLFPRILPQQIIDLELGVTGLNININNNNNNNNIMNNNTDNNENNNNNNNTDNDENNNNNNNNQNDTLNLLAAARKWREAYQKSRDAYQKNRETHE